MIARQLIRVRAFGDGLGHECFAQKPSKKLVA